MNKPIAALLALALITMPLFSVNAINSTVNPITRPEVPAPSGVDIVYDFQSPVENASYPNGVLNVVFNATVQGPSSINGQGLNKHLGFTLYQGDWMQETQWCPVSILSEKFHACNFSVSGIPSGRHVINFTGYANGDFVLANGSSVAFRMEKTVTYNFSVPEYVSIAFLMPQNANVTGSAFPLNFTVNHPITELTYVLDGQEPVAIAGNITLADLAAGRHNVTVYATDTYGSSGASETLIFNVYTPETFPFVPVVAALVVVIVTFGLLLVFIKRRKKTIDLNQYSVF
jgi:hypothetical protein